MNNCGKPIILVFVGHYLPSNKASGILRVTINTVNYLCDEFEFKIITRDRDLGDKNPHSGIEVNQWQRIGNATVYYLSPQASSLRNILNLIENTPHDVLYLNSFFDLLTIKVLLNRKFCRMTFKPVIVAPWGDFGWASLKQKYPKKFVFIQLARLIGLYGGVTWRASSEFEKMDIIKNMKNKTDLIHITRDLPVKNEQKFASDLSFVQTTSRESLRIIFLSRIAREKNLDYALQVLKKVNTKVIFDIYGPAENEDYWKECQKLIDQLPVNIAVSYLGNVNPDQVVNVFSRYDLFLFPTGGEAYGHVIAECLISGTPVLVSTETPWRNLQADGLGWDVDLKRTDSFVKIIEDMAFLSDEDRLKKRTVVKKNILKRLLDPAVLEENRQLFLR